METNNGTKMTNDAQLFIVTRQCIAMLIRGGFTDRLTIEKIEANLQSFYGKTERDRQAQYENEKVG